MKYINSRAFALELDLKDPLSKFRSQFYVPQKNETELLYLCGNSLGLQPKNVGKFIDQELNKWATRGVEGHFDGERPWFNYHELLAQPMANIVGALPAEVVVMNTLTVNLHLMLTSFYRPTSKHYKIICEEKAFSSDQYALESQVKLHGFKPEDAIVEMQPRHGEHNLRDEDIIKTIRAHADSLALVMIGGLNYYTGQVFDMQKITHYAHKCGAHVGFDLAHAVGNISLDLHHWDVDFAVWCGYKYLNSGPGGVAGLFVHERHGNNMELPRLAGWWGHDAKTRFMMEKGFKPMTGAEGWQLSNSSVLSMTAMRASLQLFEEAGMTALCKKSEMLTGYLEFLLNEVAIKYPEAGIEIITPPERTKRGCQLSIFIAHQGHKIFKKMTDKGVMADWREPAVIRVAPVPLYNSFEEVYRFSEIFSQILSQI